MSNKKSHEIIKKIRFDLNLSQTEFANRVGIKQSYVSRVENIHIDIGFNKLQDWCEKLGISLTKYL